MQKEPSEKESSSCVQHIMNPAEQRPHLLFPDKNGANDEQQTEKHDEVRNEIKHRSPSGNFTVCYSRQLIQRIQLSIHHDACKEKHRHRSIGDCCNFCFICETA